MAHWKEGPKPIPWLPVHSDGAQREPVAPSKPAVPARSSSEFQPEPVVVEDPGADIIAPVAPPAPEEIMPTDGRAPWESVPMFRDDAFAPASPIADPIQSLGDAAVRRASLSASGAATPLGGVAPSAPSSYSAPAPPSGEVPLAVSPYQTEPDLGDAQPDSAPASALDAPVTAPGFMDIRTPPSAPTPPRTATPEIEESLPRDPGASDPPPVTGTSEDEGGGRDEPPVKDERTPWWRSWPFLVLVGLLALGGVAYAVVMAMSDSDPDPVELTAPVIVPTPDEATHEAISIPDPSEFQAALPQTVGPFALTGFEAPDVASLDLLEPAAEANLLTYQYQDVTLSVRAVQHFDADAALRHFDAVAVGGAELEPVSAGAVDVGERVTLTAQDADTIVWRNNTALFFVTGPAQEIEEFFTQFPL